jgi:hypothetical protein
VGLGAVKSMDTDTVLALAAIVIGGVLIYRGYQAMS